MARPTKSGLDYYPMDVGFLRDKKVKLLRAEFGASSVLFVLYVFGKAYEEDGYFLRWDKDECLLAADELREKPSYISAVLQGCLSRSLFDERVFQTFSVLTSAGIQRRDLRGCEKRDEIKIASEYWLLDVEDKKDVTSSIRAKLTFFEISGGKNFLKSPGNPVNSHENPQSKEKESKGKETLSGGGKYAYETESNVDQYLHLRSKRLSSYKGMTSEIMKIVNHLTNAIFKRFATRLPTEYDITNVFEYLQESKRAPESDQWIIELPQERQELLFYAFEQAVAAGKPADWNYINGILKNLKRRNIQSIEEAEDYEYERDQVK